MIVRHDLPVYFLNAVRAVRALAPNDPLLVIDNASPDQDFLRTLKSIKADDSQIRVILRRTNELHKVLREITRAFAHYGPLVWHERGGGYARDPGREVRVGFPVST